MDSSTLYVNLGNGLEDSLGEIRIELFRDSSGRPHGEMSTSGALAHRGTSDVQKYAIRSTRYASPSRVPMGALSMGAEHFLHAAGHSRALKLP